MRAAACALAGALLAVAAPARAQDAALEEPGPSFPLRLAVQTEGAIGAYPGSFYNQLAGARLDVQFSPHVSLGGYVGYANLKGKGGRAHDGLAYAQVEYMFGAPGAAVRVPIRFGSGYLPGNGPVVRMAAGLAFALGPKTSLVTELLAPMLWLTGNEMVLSMNLSLEARFDLGVAGGGR
jgi:hypothetical protein